MGRLLVLLREGGWLGGSEEGRGGEGRGRESAGGRVGEELEEWWGGSRGRGICLLDESLVFESG